MTLLRSFGFIGIASILTWMVALVALAVGWRHKRRGVLLVAALVIALAGLGLATLNSHYVSAIEPDRSQYIERGLQLQAELGEAADKADEVGKDGKEEDGKEEPAAPNAEPAYKQAGKKQRDEGKHQKIEAFEAVAAPEEEVYSGPKMSETEVTRANRYDRLNLLFARLVPWLAAGLIALDLLLRFNPVLGKVASASARGAPCISVPQGALHQHLEDRVRRGESFIYFGEQDLFPEGVLHRLHLWKWRLKPLPRLLYDADSGGMEDWKNGERAACSGDVPVASGPQPPNLPSFRSSNHPPISDSGFVFDGVWFARYAFVVRGRDASDRLLAELLEYLRQRRVPRAAAFRTVGIVWDFPQPIPPETVEELEFLAADTNFRLVVHAVPQVDGTALVTDSAGSTGVDEA